MAKEPNSGDAVVTIKKYANRRLYNTATSSYVTLDHLCQMVKDGVEFVVYDAKSGEDITRSVLTQIIFEEESKGQNLLPIQFLRQLIGFYDDSLQSVVPRYLEMSMEAFARNQEQMRDAVSQTLVGASPFQQFEELGRQNVAMFQQALSMFNPFVSGTATQPPPKTEDTPAPDKRPAETSDELSRLRDQIDQMQDRLNDLAGKD